jgi:hypothetical protein
MSGRQPSPERSLQPALDHILYTFILAFPSWAGMMTTAYLLFSCGITPFGFRRQ